MAAEITQYLLSAQSPDVNLRTEVETILGQFQEENYPEFLLSLSSELSDDGKPTESRTLAVFILMNSIDGKETARREQLHQQWVAMDLAFKSRIKNNTVNALGSSVQEARHTTSLAVSKISAIEIPQNKWPELLWSLLANMTQRDQVQRQVTMQTIRYIFEEVSHGDVVQVEFNAALRAVLQGMHRSQLYPDVRLAAAKALNSALDLGWTTNLGNVAKNYVMEKIFGAALATETATRQAAFSCLVSMASIHFEVLERFRERILKLTSDAIRGDEDVFALQAVEFLELYL